jgi:hypothetical protein
MPGRLQNPDTNAKVGHGAAAANEASSACAGASHQHQPTPAGKVNDMTTMAGRPGLRNSCTKAAACFPKAMAGVDVVSRPAVKQEGSR